MKLVIEIIEIEGKCPVYDAAFLQCLDPQKHTGGGTVTLKITRE